MDPINPIKVAAAQAFAVKTVDNHKEISELQKKAYAWLLDAQQKAASFPLESLEAKIAKDCASEAEAIISQLKVVKKEKTTVFVAFDSYNKVQGIAIACLHGKSGKASTLDNMVVNPDRIKLIGKNPLPGTGTALVKAIVSKIWHNKDSRKELCALALDAAVPFYNKLGFKNDFADGGGVADGLEAIHLTYRGMKNLMQQDKKADPVKASPAKPAKADPAKPVKVLDAAPVKLVQSVSIGKTKVEKLKVGKINPFQVTYTNKTAEAQAQEIIDYLKSCVNQHPDTLIAITYAANAAQSAQIFQGYKDGLAPAISGSNQAKVFEIVSKALNTQSVLKGKVVIAPIATCQHVDKKRQAPTELQVNQSLENIHNLLVGNHQHIKGGKKGGKCIVLGLQNEECDAQNPFAIGLGVAKEAFKPFKKSVDDRLIKMALQGPSAHYYPIKK